MKKGKKLTIIAVICFTLVIPYIYSEILTQIYGREFQNFYKETGWMEQMDYFKIRYYSAKRAEVYYIEKGKAVFLCEFEFEKKWELKEWRCIKSKSGSANEFIWPYYPL